MQILDTLADTQTLVVDQVVAAQTKFVDANRNLAGRYNEFAGKLPAAPMADEALALSRSMVTSWFEMSAKLIEANRNFTVDLIDAWVPAAKPAKATTPK